MIVQQATTEVFLTAFKTLPRREQEENLGRKACDRRLRRVLEDVSDRLVPKRETRKAPQANQPVSLEFVSGIFF